MELRNCERCGKAFIKTSPQQSICPQCEKLEEEEFVTVKEYLQGHPGMPLEKIAETLEIPKQTVLRFIQSGRLEVAGSHAKVCINCGQPLERGTMCPECQALLLKELHSLHPSAPKPDQQVPPKSSQKSTGFHSRRPD